MGMRFRRSKSLGAGTKLNLSKSSIGLSGGVKGARISTNSKGRVTKSVGIPGTGISYVSSKGKGSSTAKEKMGFFTAVKWLLILALAYIILVYLWIPIIVIGVGYFIYCRIKDIAINKKYVAIGALLLIVSLGFFIYKYAYSDPHNAAISSSVSSSQMISK